VELPGTILNVIHMDSGVTVRSKQVEGNIVGILIWIRDQRTKNQGNGILKDEETY